MHDEDSKRLRSVEGHIIELKTLVKPLSEKVGDHDRFINGHNGTPGAKTRFDRLEQDAQKRKVMVRVISIPVVGGIVKWVWEHWQ